MPRERPLPDGGFLFFGDSFVRIFTLIGNPEIGVKAFKGATAKGLTKEKNENRQEIIETLGARPGTQCAIFVFGNVDVHMSYYYCKHGKETPEPQDAKKIATEYANFVSSLPGEQMERLIIGAYPSSLVEPDRVPQSLAAYGVLTEEQAAKIDQEDCAIDKR